MLKTVVAATAAVAIAGSSLAYAQPREGRPDGSRRWQPTTEDVRAFQAARLAALHAGLMLTPEQEQHWPAFEQAVRELQKLWLARVAERREARRDRREASADPIERMRQRAMRLSERSAVLKRLADATDPLYRRLDDTQKRRFVMLARMTGTRASHRRGPGSDRQRPTRERRSDIAPVTPQAERTFGHKEFGHKEGVAVTVSSNVSPVGFGGKVRFEQPAGFGAKVAANTGVGGSLVAAESRAAESSGARIGEVEGVRAGNKAVSGEAIGSRRHTVLDI